MRIVIFGALAFVLGLSGSTGVLVLTAPAHSPAADSLAMAKVRAHGPASAPLVAVTPSPAPVAVAPTTSVRVPVPVHMAPDTNAARPAPTTAVAAAQPHAPVVTRVVPPAVAALAAPGPNTETYKQVGSILLNMKPAEAAHIVAYLNDDQLEGLLRSMSARQAAVVFAQLPAERGAALSRRLLIPAKEDRP
jgi:hypothetical protein